MVKRVNQNKNIFKKLFIVSAIVVGFAVALLPLVSYAEVVDTSKAHVAVTVTPALTLEVTIPNEDDRDPDDPTEKTILFAPVAGNPEAKTFRATVTSNSNYALSLNALDGETNMLPPGKTISEVGESEKIPTSATLEPGISAWAVKLGTSEDWSAVPEDITEFFEYTDGAVVENETDFNVGLSIGAALLSGEYSSTLVVTAATK